MTDTAHQIARGTVSKVDPAQQLVFGWASVAVKTDGEQLVDVEQDLIDPEELEQAAYTYVLESRDGGEMHVRKGVSRMVESLVVTEDKLAAWATDAESGEVDAERLEVLKSTFPLGWWIGFKVDDPDVWSEVQKGRYRMFSIHGTAKRVPVE